MSARPWYKRYGADFVHGTLGLTLEEKGAYSLILDLIYDRGGPIADDPRYIAGVCGCSIRKWATIRARLIETGTIEIDGDYLTNHRAERELDEAAKHADKLAESGAKGGRQRVENAASRRDNFDENAPKLSDNSAQIEAKINENNDLAQARLKHRAHKPEGDIEKKEVPEAKASGAKAPPIRVSVEAKAPEAELFRIGRELLGKSGGGVVTELRKHFGYNDRRVFDVLELAAGKENPRSWLGGVLRNSEHARTSEREYAEIYRGVQ